MLFWLPISLTFLLFPDPELAVDAVIATWWAPRRMGCCGFSWHGSFCATHLEFRARKDSVKPDFAIHRPQTASRLVQSTVRATRRFADRGRWTDKREHHRRSRRRNRASPRGVAVRSP